MIKPLVIDPNPDKWELCPSCRTKHLAPVREALRTSGGRLYRILFYQACICGFSTRPELKPCRWDEPLPKSAAGSEERFVRKPAIHAPVVVSRPAAATGSNPGVKSAGKGKTVSSGKQAALPGFDL